MERLEELNNQLYSANYGVPPKGNIEEIWDSIKNDKELLKEAIKVIKSKWYTDRICGTAIGDMMLLDFQNVDSDIYQELINTIYSNRDIARICLDSSWRSSFLLMSLWNFDLKLTEEQKAFAVSEAMNMPGTAKYDGKNPTNMHGSGDFGIHYWILRNPNWTLEEKQQLVMKFYEDDDDYDETLEQWEWAVVNDEANFKGEAFPPFDRYELFNDWDYDRLLKYHGNKEVTDRIWEEMEFCKQMHQLRPMQWETTKIDICAQITVTNGTTGNRTSDIEHVLERIAKMLGFSATLENSTCTIEEDGTKEVDTVVYQKKFPLR